MQFNTPKDLVNFFRYFVNGPYVGRELTPLKTLRIKFISVDLVFAETFGRWIPAKHLQIEMAIKSLTVSKSKVITTGWIVLVIALTTTE